MLNMAVGQNQWYHFGVGAPPILVYFSGDWDSLGVRIGFGPMATCVERSMRIWGREACACVHAGSVDRRTYLLTSACLPIK